MMKSVKSGVDSSNEPAVHRDGESGYKGVGGQKSSHAFSSGKPAPDYLAVGRLRRPHGVKGEVALEVLTDFPERLREGSQVYAGDDHFPLVIASTRWHKDLLLLRFTEHDDRNDVEDLRNLLLYTLTSGLPRLPEGEYYHHQLIGLNVVDEAGNVLGKLNDILETGANDVYVVTSDKGEMLVPAIESVVMGVDLARGEIKIRPQVWE